MSTQHPVSFFRFFLLSLTAGLLFAVLAGATDAAITRFTQGDRPFTHDLLLESGAAHGVFCFAIILLTSFLYRLLPFQSRTTVSQAGSFRVGFSVISAIYFLTFIGFYYYVDMVGDPRALQQLTSYPSISYGILLLISTVVCGRMAYRFVGGSSSRPSPPWARVAITCTLLVAISGTGFFLLPELQKGSAEAASSFRPEETSTHTIPETAAKNVMVLIMDTTRRDRLSVYGHDRPTSPNLERLASEGAVFQRATSSATYTLSSHASILTGKLPSQHGATMRSGHLSASSRTMAECLKDASRNTAAFVANRVLRTESGVSRGFDLFNDLVDPQVCQTGLWDVVHNVQSLASHYFKALKFDGQPHWIEDHQRPAELQNKEILEWVNKNRDEPFFLFVNYYDPHWPYLPEEEFRKKFEVAYDGPISGYLFRDNEFKKGYELTEEDHEYLFSLYDAEIAYLDHHIGKLTDALREQGILDDTLLVITSDHGEYFGEHGCYSHKELYEEVVGVPLLMRLPGTIPAGVVIDDPVQLTDIAPTVLELAGATIPRGVQGRSLAGLLSASQEEGKELAVLAEDYDHQKTVRKMARLGGFKLIKSFDGKDNEELYNLNVDPRELENLLTKKDGLSDEDGMKEKLEALLALIHELGAEEETANQQGKPDAGDVDRKAREALEALGYLEGEEEVEDEDEKEDKESASSKRE